ncbi:MAG: sugar ABC transporter substrate-binding protein [Butyricicoccus sp.]|nr:sugar ABC transporter substrate-binding protein [Butyricicoccus sp.]MBQ8586293.1 sugar ABC transporter substrate-binding protein [Butyricicoccus sp.]
MNMKRLIAMLLAAMMCVSLAACGGADTASDAASSAEEGGYKLALLMSHQTNAFTTAVSAGAVDKAAELGITVDVLDGKQDPSTQASQIETCIAQGYDGVMVEPISADAIVPAVKAANEAGMPVITVVQQMKNQDTMAVAYCGGDESKAGKLQMEKALEMIGGKGNIVVLYGPMGSDAQLSRKAGYDEVLAGYPDVKIVFEDTANWTTEEALSKVETWLQTGTEINAVIAQNDSMALGALKACEDAGMDIPCFGLDAVDDALAAVKAGRLDGTVSQDAYGQGAMGVEVMVAHLNGETVEALNFTECVWIDESNIADYVS